MSRNWERTESGEWGGQQAQTGQGVNRYLPPLVVNHHIMGLDVSVHNAFGVAIIQGLSGLRVRWRFQMVRVKARTLRSSNM